MRRAYAIADVRVWITGVKGLARTRVCFETIFLSGKTTNRGRPRSRVSSISMSMGPQPDLKKFNILNELLSLNPRKVSISLVTPNQSTSNHNFLSSTLQAGGLANTARTYTIYSVPLIDVELDFLSSIFFRRISNSFLDSKNVGIKSINRKYLIFP